MGEDRRDCICFCKNLRERDQGYVSLRLVYIWIWAYLDVGVCGFGRMWIWAYVDLGVCGFECTGIDL